MAKDDWIPATPGNVPPTGWIRRLSSSRRRAAARPVENIASADKKWAEQHKAKGAPPVMTMAAAAYLSVVTVMSLVCFLAYSLDKRQAINGGRRVSERTLHLLAFLGGWPGALLAQRQFRHKTQKVPFRIVFWMVVGLHVGIVSALTYALVTFGPA